jgi:hypothetical protein
MTEAEAKKKWCPMARIDQYKGDTTPAYNRLANGAKPPVQANCLGSGCMLWQSSYGDARNGECGLSRTAQ